MAGTPTHEAIGPGLVLSKEVPTSDPGSLNSEAVEIPISLFLFYQLVNIQRLVLESPD